MEALSKTDLSAINFYWKFLQFILENVKLGLAAKLTTSVLEDTTTCINYFCKEKARLTKIGKLIDDNDLYIGTTAVAVNMPIYTYNIKHFSRIEGLKLYEIN